MEESILSVDVVKAVQRAERNILDSVNIFDIYSGKNIEDGKKSIAFKVVLQPKEKTLTDEEIESISSKIIDLVEKDTGGKLRA